MALLVVSIISPKGGTMKTTTALNIIARLIIDKFKAVLLDCDEGQHSSFKRNLVRKQNGIKPDLPIRPIELKDLKKVLLEIGQTDTEVAVVELGAKSEKAIALAAAASSLVVINLKGSSLDTDTIETIKKGLLNKPKDTAVVIVPSMITGANGVRYLQEVVNEIGEDISLTKTFIKNLDCYVTCFDDGRTIFDIKPKTKTEIGAVENFEKLYQELIYGQKN